MDRVDDKAKYQAPLRYDPPRLKVPEAPPAALTAAKARAVDWYESVSRRPLGWPSAQTEGEALRATLVGSAGAGVKAYEWLANMRREERAKDLARRLDDVQQLVAGNAFQIARPFAEAAGELGPIFPLAVSRLRPTDVWLDIGAGRGHVQRDVATQLGAASPQMIAVARVAPSAGYEAQWCADMPTAARARYLAGRAFEDVGIDELPKATLASDCYGACTYGPKLDLALRRAAEALAPGGMLCVATFRDNVFLDRRGQVIWPYDYASAIGGLELLHWGQSAHSMSFTWRRTEAPLQVPRLALAMVDGWGGLPSYRAHRVMAKLG